MQSQAKDVTTYLKEVPAERRAALEELRRLCLVSLKGFEESMMYGSPCYSRNGVAEVGFASQKQFIGLYILRTDGYSKPEKIDLDVVKSMLKATVESTGWCVSQSTEPRPG